MRNPEGYKKDTRNLFVEVVRTTGKNKVSGGEGGTGSHDWDPWGELVRVVANQPVKVREHCVVGRLEGTHLTEERRENHYHVYLRATDHRFTN